MSHKTKRYPGPQVELFFSSFRPIYFFIVNLIFIGLLTTQTYWVVVYHENPLPISIDRSVMLVASLIALSFTVRHFSLSMKPLLTYEYSLVDKSEMGLKGKVFQVKLKNAGNGVGVFYDLNYEITSANEMEEISTRNPKEVIQSLVPLGLDRHLSYEIFFARPGYTLSSKEEKVIFEISPDDVAKIGRLDIQIRIESILGNRFVKWIFCVPREMDISLPSVKIT